MILLISSINDPVMTHFRGWLDKNRANYLFLAQDDFILKWDITWKANGNKQKFQFTIKNYNRTLQLDQFYGIYARLAAPADTTSKIENMHYQYLETFLNLAPIKVVNRPYFMNSNSSKPYQQALLHTAGLATPDTMITNIPSLVTTFKKTHKSVIFKSISSIRSKVRELDDGHEKQLSLIKNCPTQFQKRVVGNDIRVHIIEDYAHAVLIKSNRIDYRYKDSITERPTYQQIELPDKIQKKCINATRKIGLFFSGIDLMVTPAGEYICFEINPSPGYSSFEKNTNTDAISNKLYNFLASNSNL